MKNYPTTWVIVPAYNEEKYVAHVLQKLKKTWSNIIVIDDGSHDKTFEIAQKIVPHTLRHPLNLGKGAALKTGCEYAFSVLKAEAVIFFDADDQHDATLLPAFAESLQHHAVVLGVRSFDTRMPLLRIMLNRLGSVLVLLLFGSYVPDIPCGYKGFTKTAYTYLKWNSRDYAVEMEIAAKIAKNKLDFMTISIPTIYHDLDRGMNLLDTFAVVRQLIAWRLSK